MEVEFMTADTTLPPCMPLPRAMLRLPISSTAKVMYARMLDIVFLSGIEDANGILFIHFPIVELAAALARSTMTVKRSLNELEDAGLILRVRQGGFHDERYLWPEMLRVIRELQPRWVLGENVAGFLRMGLDKTLIDLEQAGYDVRVFVLPAAAVGAWHERKRVFIIGSAASHTPCQRHRGCGQGAGHPNLCEWQLPQDEQGWQGVDGAAFPCGLPDDPHHAGKALPQPGLGRVADGFPAQMDGHSLWAEEPADIPRLTEEVPNRSKRMKTLGNAVSPPQVFPILKYIADIETGRCPMGGEEL